MTSLPNPDTGDLAQDANRIGALEFRFDVDQTSRQLGAPEKLLMAVRAELLEVIDSTISEAARANTGIRLEQLNIDLGAYPDPPDWQQVRATLRHHLMAELTPYLRPLSTPMLQTDPARPNRLQDSNAPSSKGLLQATSNQTDRSQNPLGTDGKESSQASPSADAEPPAFKSVRRKFSNAKIKQSTAQQTGRYGHSDRGAARQDLAVPPSRAHSSTNIEQLSKEQGSMPLLGDLSSVLRHLPDDGRDTAMVSGLLSELSWRLQNAPDRLHEELETLPLHELKQLSRLVETDFVSTRAPIAERDEPKPGPVRNLRADVVQRIERGLLNANPSRDERLRETKITDILSDLFLKTGLPQPNRERLVGAARSARRILTHADQARQSWSIEPEPNDAYGTEPQTTSAKPDLAEMTRAELQKTIDDLLPKGATELSAAIERLGHTAPDVTEALRHVASALLAGKPVDLEHACRATRFVADREDTALTAIADLLRSLGASETEIVAFARDRFAPASLQYDESDAELRSDDQKDATSDEMFSPHLPGDPEEPGEPPKHSLHTPKNRATRDEPQQPRGADPMQLSSMAQGSRDQNPATDQNKAQRHGAVDDTAGQETSAHNPSHIDSNFKSTPKPNTAASKDDARDDLEITVSEDAKQAQSADITYNAPPTTKAVDDKTGKPRRNAPQHDAATEQTNATRTTDASSTTQPDDANASSNQTPNTLDGLTGADVPGGGLDDATPSPHSILPEDAEYREEESNGGELPSAETTQPSEKIAQSSHHDAVPISAQGSSEQDSRPSPDLDEGAYDASPPELPTQHNATQNTADRNDVDQVVSPGRTHAASADSAEMQAPERRLAALFDAAMPGDAPRLRAMLDLMWSAVSDTADLKWRDQAQFWQAALVASLSISHQKTDPDHAISTFLAAIEPDEALRHNVLRILRSRLGYGQPGQDPVLRHEVCAALDRLLETDRHPAKAAAEPVTNTDFEITEHAGLVIFHPYLPMLFDRLDLLTPQKGIQPNQVSRAAGVLAALSDVAPRHGVRDPLDRLLLALPDTIELEYEALSDSDRSIVESLVLNVISQWPRLGQTSPAGLRDAFIRRTGVLRTDNDAPRLLVDEGPYDMLLDGLPWSLSPIALPWMATPLNVIWRQRDD